ncbi:MAG: hypothetical protein FJZ43_04295 [Candidatus Staskawiczbacteria bacterium]|nr:hypothetical protein [Candidatus Staskawiczbacteria bacterium]
MIISKIHGEWAYILGRLVALSSRPIILLVLKHWGNEELAVVVAVFFLISILAVAISGFDTHRSFYKLYFGAGRRCRIKDTYKTYCNSILFQIGLVSPLLVGFVFFRFDDLLLSVLLIIFFASERLADEAQRFLIFNRKRKEWGVRIFAKAIFQIIFISILLYFFDLIKPHFIVFVLSIGNLIAYGTKFSVRYLKKIEPCWSKLIIQLRDQRLFWLLSSMTTIISHLDRVIVMIFQQSDLAVYTILVSSMSIIQNLIDYFYISLRRLEILQGKIGLRDVLYSRRFQYTLAIAIFIGCCASFIVLNIYYDMKAYDFELVPIVLVGQISLAVTLLVREIIYWNQNILRLIIAEGCFIVVVTLGIFLLSNYESGYKTILGLFSLLLILRLVIMTRFVCVVTLGKNSNE